MRYLVHDLRRNTILIIRNIIIIQSLHDVSICIIIVAVAIKIKVVFLKCVLYALLFYSLMLGDRNIFAYFTCYALLYQDEAVVQLVCLGLFQRVHWLIISVDA